MAFANPAPIRRQPRLGHAHKSIRPALTIAPAPAAAPQHGTAPAVKGYDAARQDRLVSDWQAVSRLSADAELQGKLPISIDQEAACFRGRRWPWVDPEKDVAAN